MSEIPFAYTVQGKRFFEQSVPDAIAALDRLNATLVELVNTIESTAARRDALELASAEPSVAEPVAIGFQPGAQVVIRNNPFHEDAVDIVGTVLEYQPGVGFMGADLVHVRYERPRDGTVHERPFATTNLDQGDRAALLARAARHEQQARKLRAMAKGSASATKQPLRVPRDVFEGIEAVRRDGRTNMLDRPVVAQLADELGFHDAARWVRQNRALYAQAVFHGFEVTDEDGGDEPPQPKEI